MKFKWRQCTIFRGEINLVRNDLDAVLGWVADQGDGTYSIYMREADCPSEQAQTLYPTALQAMRALRREYLTMLIAGEFNDD